MTASGRRTSGAVFYRKLNRKLPLIVRAEGVYLYDETGKRYLDACGGAMVASVGHGVREIAEAIGTQASTVAYVNGTMFSNVPVETLADMLIDKAPPNFGKAYFLSSGSEAVEAALKLARQYHVERGESSRRIIIARTPGYHGNTILALSASARKHYRDVYQPWLLDVRMIDAPYPYRAGPLGDHAPALTGEALETAILSVGASNVAAFIAEPIGGSSTGASVAPPQYYAHIREICDRYGVLFIADEVLTGVGRTGKFFALEHFKDRNGKHVQPDIITLGKGINGGYAPLSAMLASNAVFDTIACGSFGGLVHAQTYSHHAVGCAAGLATLEYIDKHGLVDRAAQAGAFMQSRLRALATSSDCGHLIGDVRGIGMLAGIEFVADRESKKPFTRSLKMVERVVDAALARGLVVWPNTGHADGENGDLILIAPPLTIREAEIEEMASLLSATLTDVAKSLKDDTAPKNVAVGR